MRRFPVVPLLVLVLAGGLAACGSDGGGTATPAAAGTTAAATGATIAAAGFRVITPSDAAALLADASSGVVVLDVRTPEEFAAGHLAGAVNLDLRSATFDADLALLDHATSYLVYCHSGNRSAMAVQAMQQLGFTDVADLQGGITAWQSAGYAVTT